MAVIVLFGFCGINHAAASVIDIIELSDGTFNITSDGQPYGHGMSRVNAEKVAQKLSKQGNSVNWKWRGSASSGVGATPKSANVPPSTNTGKVATGAQKALPAAQGQKALPAGNTGRNLPATTSKTQTAAKSAGSAASKVGGVLGVASGAYMIYDSHGDGEQKATWGDVAEGAAGGAIATQSLIALNAIPVAGSVAYAVAVGVGTVAGAAVAGKKVFAETDCDYDPVRKSQACCNVSRLTNLKGVYANIGEKMFAEYPYVRTCLQGGKPYESNWFKARFLDDKWSDGVMTYCSGWEKPTEGNINIYADTNKICWFWECSDEGKVRQGNKCVSGKSETAVKPAHKAGEPCEASDLPQYAVSGKYINAGKASNGVPKIVCAATECKKGTYLVKNDNGESQGWCKAGMEPVAAVVAEDASVSDVTDESAGADVGAVTDDGAGTDNNAQDGGQNVVQNNCESGVPGYLIFEGNCISETQYNVIIEQWAEAERIAHQRRVNEAEAKIKSASARLKGISDGFTVSVWKNKDGKFNTARLASDSVAGVVLGTVGGLVTSSVIKKNQIKSGFEDISCTIGGQTVAQWGDEFRVGISQ